MTRLTTSQKISLYYSGLTIVSLVVFFILCEVFGYFINSEALILAFKLGLIGVLAIGQYIFGKYLSRYLLRDLKCIANKVSKLSLSSEDKTITCNLPSNDEIYILAEALNKSYKALEEETQKLKQFQTDVSHEFKTPLMVMQSRLDVLEKKYQKGILCSDEQKIFFELAKKNISEMNRLIETLFFLSRCEASDGTCLQREDVDMKAFFEDKKAEILSQYQARDIELKLDIEKNLIYHIEPVSFSILLNNLIENALKFGANSIKLSAKNTYFSVSDNGPGISELEQEKIFEKFYRTDTNKEGFGVGLSLVKRISEMYQWRIELTSTEGKGTEFRCIF